MKLRSENNYIGLISLTVILTIVLGFWPSTTLAMNYTLTIIDATGTKEPTVARGINNSGNIVGWYADSSSFHGFLYDEGNFTTIDVPGATYTIGQAINNSGNIVGYCGDANNGTHGFLYDGGNFTTIDVPGAYSTMLYGINNSGKIVGEARTQTSIGGFLYEGGIFTPINVPGADYTTVFGINDSNKIVGLYNDTNGVTHGFLYESGNYTTIDVPGANGSTVLRGINNSDTIVADRAIYANFLYAEGIFTPIDIPGTQYTTVHGINDFDQIVGEYQDVNHVSRGFIGTPIPTPIPPAVWLLGSGLLGLAGFKRRFKK